MSGDEGIMGLPDDLTVVEDAGPPTEVEATAPATQPKSTVEQHNRLLLNNFLLFAMAFIYFHFLVLCGVFLVMMSD